MSGLKELQTDRFKKLSPEDKSQVAYRIEELKKTSAEILRTMSRYSKGAAAANLGFKVTFGNGSEERPDIIIFDMKDGSHCYYIDPPGICCCGAC